MAAPTDKPAPFDPFGIVAATSDWCCLLKAAHELRNIDAEMMATMLEADATAPNVVNLMRSLGLDPEAIRQRKPEALRELDAVCQRLHAERAVCRRAAGGDGGRQLPGVLPECVAPR